MHYQWDYMHYECANMHYQCASFMHYQCASGEGSDKVKISQIFGVT